MESLKFAYATIGTLVNRYSGYNAKKEYNEQSYANKAEVRTSPPCA